MQAIDIILIAAIGLAVFFAVRHVLKTRGSCGGDCASCRKSCAQRGQKKGSSRKVGGQ